MSPSGKSPEKNPNAFSEKREDEISLTDLKSRLQVGYDVVIRLKSVISIREVTLEDKTYRFVKLVHCENLLKLNEFHRQVFSPKGVGNAPIQNLDDLHDILARLDLSLKTDHCEDAEASYFWPNDAKEVHINEMLPIKSISADLTLHDAMQCLALSELRVRAMLKSRLIQRYRYGFDETELISAGIAYGGFYCQAKYEDYEPGGIFPHGSRELLGIRVNGTYFKKAEESSDLVHTCSTESLGFVWGSRINELLEGMTLTDDFVPIYSQSQS